MSNSWHISLWVTRRGRMKNKKKSGWWKVELKEEKKIETEEERERERVRDWGIFLGVSSLTTSVARASCLELLVSLCNPASKETPFSQPETGLTLSVCTTVRVPKDNFSLRYCYSIKGNSCIEATLLKITFPSLIRGRQDSSGSCQRPRVWRGIKVIWKISKSFLWWPFHSIWYFWICLMCYCCFKDHFFHLV